MNEKQLKTIKGAKYRVVTEDDWVFSEGAMIQLADNPMVDDDGTEYIQEGHSYGKHYMFFHEIELVELPENAFGGDVAAIALTKVEALEERVKVLEQAAEEPEQAKETPEPLYTVGQKLRVKGNGNPAQHYFDIGTEVEVLRVRKEGDAEGKGSYRYYTSAPNVYFNQHISEADLEPAEQSHISEEEFAAIKVGDKIVLRSDLAMGNDYGAESVNSAMVDLAKREVEITVERISADDLKGRAEGDYWWYTAEMIAKVIPAIKPKFKVGDIINRPEYGDSLYYARLVTEVDAVNGTYVMRWADGSHPDYRIEYSFDEAESAFIKMEEPAEEEKAPEYDNPDIEVGKVYIDDDSWMFYCDDVSKVEKLTLGYRKIYVNGVTALTPTGGLELKANYGCANYREATPEEAVKLLSAAFQDKAA